MKKSIHIISFFAILYLLVTTKGFAYFNVTMPSSLLPLDYIVSLTCVGVLIYAAYQLYKNWK
ncbi:MAG: hypothetical protein RR565_10230 [Erysipelothrix sp.]